MHSGNRRRWSPLLLVASLLCASAALIACIFAVPYIPTNDGPQVILAGFMENHYSDPESIFRLQVEPTLQFAHRGFSFLFVPLEALLGWQTALKLTLSIIALTTAWGFAALVGAISPERKPLGLAGFVLSLGWNLYMGFFSYAWALGLGLFILASVVARKDKTLVGKALLALGLGFQALCHVFASALTGLVLVAIVAFRSERGQRLKALSGLGLMGTPAVAVFAAAYVQHGELEQLPFSSEWVSLRWAERVTQLPHILCPGPGYRSWAVLAVCLSSLVLAFSGWRRLEKAERGLAVAASSLVVAGLLAPLHMPGWQLLSPRFAPFGALLALSLIPFERVAKTRYRTAAWAMTAGAAFASLWVSAKLHGRLYASCADELSGLDQPLRRHFLQLPVLLGRGTDPVLAVEVPHMDPILHLGALYAVAHGGSIPYLFSGSSAVYAFRPKAEAEFKVPIPREDRYWSVLDSWQFQHDAAFRDSIVTELAAMGTEYEAIVAMRVLPQDVANFEARGYVADWKSGSLFVGHFSPCAATVEVVGATRPTRVDWGMVPLKDAMRGMTLPAPTPGGHENLRVEFEGVACGGVWFRFSADDGSARCAESDGAGALVRTLRRGGKTLVRCTL